MCGIVSVTSFSDKSVNSLVIEQYIKQKKRGSDGFGLFDYEFKNMVHETRERKILKWLKRYPSNNLMFHHRWPTSTANVKNACHPFSTKDYFRTNYVLIHNGVIFNDLELKKEHEKLGITYSSEQDNGTFNDSEALLWDVALYLEGKQDKLNVEGSVAFICMAIGKGNKHDKMYFARNNNPLNMHLDEDKGLMLSSEGPGEPIDADTLYSFNYVNHKMETKPLLIEEWRSSYNSQGNSGQYDADYWRKWDEQQARERVPVISLDASPEGAVNLIRWAKKNKYAREIDIRSVYNRVLEMTDNYFNKAIQQIDFEYDCLLMLLEQKRAAGEKLNDITYTIRVHEDVAYALEMAMWEYAEDTDRVEREAV